MSGEHVYLPGSFGDFSPDRSRRARLDAELTPRQIASRNRSTMHERSLRAKMTAAAKKQSRQAEDKKDERASIPTPPG
jgi:hypothetical protein